MGANLLLNFLGFDRLRTPVVVVADILSSVIVFYNWFCKRATAEADFLGSYRKYILSLISYVSCWRSTEIFSYFIFSLILWAIYVLDYGSVVFLSLILYAKWLREQILWISSLIMCTSDCGSGCFKVLRCLTHIKLLTTLMTEICGWRVFYTARTAKHFRKFVPVVTQVKKKSITASRLKS